MRHWSGVKHGVGGRERRSERRTSTTPERGNAPRRSKEAVQQAVGKHDIGTWELRTGKGGREATAYGKRGNSARQVERGRRTGKRWHGVSAKRDKRGNGARASEGPLGVMLANRSSSSTASSRGGSAPPDFGRCSVFASSGLCNRTPDSTV